VLNGIEIGMTKRQERERAAWDAIHNRPYLLGSPAGFAVNRRPANFQELANAQNSGVDWEIAWNEFFREFFRYRSPAFFQVEPPGTFSPGNRALLAGVAEFLCEEFGLPVPVWVHYPVYTLPKLWDPASDYVSDAHLHQEERAARSHPTFLKHNVIFESRWLLSF
jgi:hypothetical protein